MPQKQKPMPTLEERLGIKPKPKPAGEAQPSPKPKPFPTAELKPAQPKPGNAMELGYIQGPPKPPKGTSHPPGPWPGAPKIAGSAGYGGLAGPSLIYGIVDGYQKPENWPKPSASIGVGGGFNNKPSVGVGLGAQKPPAKPPWEGMGIQDDGDLEMQQQLAKPKPKPKTAEPKPGFKKAYHRDSAPEKPPRPQMKLAVQKAIRIPTVKIKHKA